MFGPYFERIAARATGESHLPEVRRARREFTELTGKFEEDEPWFEQRMTLFLEWYVLDRAGPGGLTPAERFLVDESAALDRAEREIFEGLTSTQRSLYRIESWQRGAIELTDLIGGGEWSVRQEDPMVGLQRGDLLDARVVPFRADLYLGGGLVFHPRLAREQILGMLEDAHAAGGLSYSLVDMLAAMRLRFDRYRNAKVRHVYRLPPDWRPG